MNFEEGEIRQIKLTHSHEEILNALQIIKDTCNKYDDCSKCPFGTNFRRCIIQENCPANWSNKSDEDVWRAFD